MSTSSLSVDELNEDPFFIDDEDTRTNIELSNASLIDHTTQLASVLKKLPSGYLIHQEHGIVYSNPAAISLFEVDDNLLYGRHIMDFVDVSRHLKNAIQAFNGIFHDSGVTDFDLPEVILTGANGKQRIVALTVYRLDWGGIPLAQITLHDLTELKESEKILVEARRVAEQASLAKSDFLAAMSHEIRTPLAGVLGMADLVLDTDLSPQQLDWMTSIKSSGGHLLNILNEVLDQSKLEAGKLEVSPVDFHLASFVRDKTQWFSPKCDEKGLTLNVNLDQALPENIHADSLRIGQVLSNLLSNAVKFTETGSITVHAHQEEKQGNCFMLRIGVTDSGIDLDKATQKKLFSAFTQADSSTSRTYGGTGLGLSISKQLAELMGGQMGVVSAPRQGSTFWFTVRCQTANKEVTIDEKRHSPDRWVASRSLHVLVADDNLINQKLLSAIFSNLNHEVTIANNGKVAVDYVETGDFDLVLMDVRMPIMDGLQATALIRSMDSEKSDIPIFGLTADISGKNVNKYLNSGLNDICYKPLDMPVLLAAIDHHLGEKIHTSIPNAPATMAVLDDTRKKDDASDTASFAKILARVSNMADQRADLEEVIKPDHSNLESTDIDILTSLGDQFLESVAMGCQNMRSPLSELHENPLNEHARSVISDMCHSFSGQGDTFGYQLITIISADADKLLRERNPLKPEDVKNLKNYVEAMSLIVAKELSGYGGKAGRILLQGLKDTL